MNGYWRGGSADLACLEANATAALGEPSSGPSKESTRGESAYQHALVFAERTLQKILYQGSKKKKEIESNVQCSIVV